MEYENRVVQDGDLFRFECACGFKSHGWPEKAAIDRGGLHSREHATGEPMPEIVDHMRQIGLAPEPNTLVTFADAEASA